MTYFFSYPLRFFFSIFFCLFYSSSYSQDIKSFSSYEMSRVKNIEGETLFAVSKVQKSRNAELGTIASPADVCKLFDHPLFNEINLGNEQELYEHERVSFREKLMEVPLGSIVDQFKSLIPFYSTDEIINLNKYNNYKKDHINKFNIEILKASIPLPDYRIRRLMYSNLNLNSSWPGSELTGLSCLPRIVHESLQWSGVYFPIDWDPNDTNEGIKNFTMREHTLSPDIPCFICLFFIKEFHTDIKNRFDEIYEFESKLKKQLLAEAAELNIQLNPKKQIPYDQSFHIQKQIFDQLAIRSETEQRVAEQARIKAEQVSAEPARIEAERRGVELREEAAARAEQVAAEQDRIKAERRGVEGRGVWRREEEARIEAKKRSKITLNDFFFYVDFLYILILMVTSKIMKEKWVEILIYIKSKISRTSITSKKDNMIEIEDNIISSYHEKKRQDKDNPNLL